MGMIYVCIIKMYHHIVLLVSDTYPLLFLHSPSSYELLFKNELKSLWLCFFLQNYNYHYVCILTGIGYLAKFGDLDKPGNKEDSLESLHFPIETEIMVFEIFKIFLGFFIFTGIPGKVRLLR